MTKTNALVEKILNMNMRMEFTDEATYEDWLKVFGNYYNVDPWFGLTDYIKKKWNREWLNAITDFYNKNADKCTLAKNVYPV